MRGTLAAADRTIATFDLTGACPLACKHCYFFAAGAPPPDLDDRAFLEKLSALQKSRQFKSALWVGGEPLLRPSLLREAMRLFPRNAIITSGAVPIPGNLGAGLLVSLEGPKEVHDALRGQGAFETALGHLARLPAGSFGLVTTLTRSSVTAIEALPALVKEARALGVLVGFYVGGEGDANRVDGESREHAVDRLLRLCRTHPGTLLNTPASLELFRPGKVASIAQSCIYVERAVAFDVRLEPKPPCTYGPAASCDSCGCPVVAAQAASFAGDSDSLSLLHALFTKGRATPAAA